MWITPAVSNLSASRHVGRSSGSGGGAGGSGSRRPHTARSKSGTREEFGNHHHSRCVGVICVCLGVRVRVRVRVCATSVGRQKILALRPTNKNVCTHERARTHSPHHIHLPSHARGSRTARNDNHDSDDDSNYGELAVPVVGWNLWQTHACAHTRTRPHARTHTGEEEGTWAFSEEDVDLNERKRQGKQDENRRKHETVDE